MAAKKQSTDGVRLTHPNGAEVVVAKGKQAQLEQMGFTAAAAAKKTASSDTSK